jgi:hypothetical protein
MNKKDIIFGLIAVAVLAGVLWYGAQQVDAPRADATPSEDSAQYFTDTTRAKVVAQIGQPIEGFTPEMFMEVYSGLVASDFEGVEAINGKYVMENGRAVFKLQVSEGDPITSADGAIENEGMRTLLANIGARLGADVLTQGDVDAIIMVISSDAQGGGNGNDNPPIAGGNNDGGTGGYACTMDAKICPDGSGVGRGGPRCEFAKCPNESALGYRTCPDEWIVNRMPRTSGDTSIKEYYIIDGARWEIAQFDRQWVERTCQLAPQYVY